MATVYKIVIKSTSAWVNYPPNHVEQEVKKLLEDKEGLNMENVEVKVLRIA